MQPKVSVVVPIYRVENYLRQCVDSLLAQTLQEIEIILVDDGSPDRCGEIADAYAQKDSRVKVIHQKNEGLGPARNSGMKIATGEYIGFVDSDDWVKPEMYESLYETAVRNHADIVVSGHCDVSYGVVAVIKPHPLAGQTIKDAEEILKIRKNLYGHGIMDKTTESFPMSVCMSVYKRMMLEAHSVQFREILSEDTIFNLAAYKHAKVITFSDQTAYCYRKEDQNSITLTYSQEKKKRFGEFLAVLSQLAAEENNADCCIRVKRTAIDYCRLYIRQVDKVQASFKRKMEYVREFAQTKEISRCWEGYPMAALPVQQRIFHWMIVHKFYGAALVLNWMRRRMGKGCA